MKRYIFLATFLLSALAATLGYGLVGPGASGDGPLFLAEFAFFRADSGKTYVEIYTQVSFKDLQFTKTGAFYSASYTIDADILTNETYIQGRSYSDTISVSDFSRTTSGQELRLSVQGFILAPGHYSCRLAVRDEETKKEASSDVEFDIPAFAPDSLKISSIQFARRIYPSNDQKNAFVKNCRFVESNIPHAYGYYAQNLYLYYEIYGLSAPGENLDNRVLTEYSFLSKSGRVVKKIKHETEKPGTSCVHSVLLPIQDLKSGEYTLEVAVIDVNSNTRARKRSVFSVGWDIFSMRDYTFAQLLDQISLIASSNEIKQLAALPEQKQREGMLDFWKTKDPTPGTPDNELMTEFYSRVNFANANFDTDGGSGWKSDRGRIYIAYGPPDEIQRSNGGFNKAPFEIWEYYQSKRRFVFVDKYGFGDYVLLNPLTLNMPRIR